MNSSVVPSLELFGLPFANLQKSQLYHFFNMFLGDSAESAEKKQVVDLPLLIFTPNPEQVMQARQSAEFSQALHQADILLPDGIGVWWSSRLFSLVKKKPLLKSKISGVEVVEHLLLVAAALKLKCLVIGGREYVKDQAGGKTVLPLKVKDAELFWTPGYQQIALPTPEEESALQKTITELQPDIIFVAFGAPYQEEWVVTHRQLLAKNKVKVAMVVGGSFDELLGKVPKTPRVLDTLGLKWLHRLILQPWRWKRQLRLIQFIGLTTRELFR